MLTRLRVSGFKNLVDVDVRFGPFTCIAGANGAGKSNLFDAIRFLGSLADHTLLDAALSVRDMAGKSGNVRDLFHRVGTRYDDKISFEAEIVIPPEGEDDLGQPAKAAITLLRYSLRIGYRAGNGHPGHGGLEILEENLSPIKLKEAPTTLQFPHNASVWRKSVLRGRRVVPFISTEGAGSARAIKLHQDGGAGGRPSSRSAANLPRTVLSAANAAESPTVALVRNEMRSWRLLQLEPSSLRKPSSLTAPTRLGPDGSNLAATVYHLARQAEEGQAPGSRSGSESPRVYARIAERLSELIDDVRGVSVDVDERRELYTLSVTDRNGTSHPAMVLSDGTLRFLALAVMELDPGATGLICLEEPENGIHPERVPAMLRLLQDIATDPEDTVGLDNPLRQVVINTHSPTVVGEVPDDSLILAETVETVRGNERFERARFSPLPDTWRAKDAPAVVPKGKLMAYLNPHMPPAEELVSVAVPDRAKRRRVVDRPDLQRCLFSPESVSR